MFLPGTFVNPDEISAQSKVCTRVCFQCERSVNYMTLHSFSSNKSRYVLVVGWHKTQQEMYSGTRIKSEAQVGSSDLHSRLSNPG
jgi:hypothetical protein